MNGMSEKIRKNVYSNKKNIYCKLNNILLRDRCGAYWQRTTYTSQKALFLYCWECACCLVFCAAFLLLFRSRKLSVLMHDNEIEMKKKNWS